MFTLNSRSPAPSRALRALCAATVLSLAACADDAPSAGDAPLGSIDCDPGAIDGGVSIADGGVDGGVADAGGDGGSSVIRDPKGAYFAEVTANGTGCPAGTWDTRLSPDGQVFTTTFSAFEAEVDPSRAVSIKDCQLGIRLHSPEGTAYTVDGATFGGFLYLEPQVQARIQSIYYFQGYPDQGSTITTDLTGPEEKQFLISDELNELSPVRSRCGTDHQLNFRLTLRVLNSTPRANGYVGIDQVTGGPKLGLKLSWKRCND